MAEPRASMGRRLAGTRAVWAAILVASTAGAVTHFTVGCSGWDPNDPLEHDSPEVEKALAQMDAGDYRSAEQTLGEFLGTGVCQGSKIGLPDAVRQKPDGTFDLGIILFYLAEKYGHKFGDEEKGDQGKIEDPEMAGQRSGEIDCAELIIKSIANDASVPLELRARAHYLAGNLEFLRRHYDEAIREYDEALKLIPGISEEAGGDGIGRDAAWNRAVAQHRLEDKQDAGPDAQDEPDSGDDGADADADAQPDGADGDDGNGGPDAGDAGDSGQDGGDSGDDKGDAGQDGGRDAGNDAADQDQKPDGGEPATPDDRSPPQPSPDPDGTDQGLQDQEDDQLLDKFEGKPTYQQEEARRRGTGSHSMEDK